MISNSRTPTVEVDWPLKAAKETLFLWKPSNKTRDGSQIQCQLVHDAKNRYLRIVDATSDATPNADPKVYDTIDVDDLIGADISIEMLPSKTSAKGSGSGIRSAAGSTLTASDTNTSNGRSMNEPSSDVAADTQAVAKLNLYVYTHQDPKTVSWFNTFGITNYHPPSSTPNYQRPPEDSQATLGRRCAHHRTLTLCPVEDLSQARVLLSAINQLARAQHVTSSKPRGEPRYLLIVNPRSGPHKNSVSLMEQCVLPMFQQAGIQTTVCITTHARHAEERCQLIADRSPGSDDRTSERDHEDPLDDISNYDAIVAMGGDGSLHEILNGIKRRPDGMTILQNTKIGIIGCGTANGLANSLSYAGRETRVDILTDVFHMAKGNTVVSDLSTYQVLPETLSDSPADHTDANDATTTNPLKEYTSFLTFSWGIIAEVDIESERIHWLGFRRFDVWAVIRVLFLRKYKVKLSYTTSATDKIPPIQEPVPPHWTTIEDEIILFWSSQVTHAGKATFLSPQTKFQDGVFSILLVRGSVSRYRLAAILLALETGTHENLPGAEWIRCTAYRLEPLTTNVHKSYNDLDGEVIEHGPIQGCVNPKAIRFFGRVASTLD